VRASRVPETIARMNVLLGDVTLANARQPSCRNETQVKQPLCAGRDFEST
jgi:hypothetical protein